jgi:transcriptional regulator of acetoin/glycerol metabolism
MSRRFAVKPSECFDSSSDPNYRPRKFEQLIGNSRALEEVLEGVKRVAPTSSTVFIQGETGTGKELIARAIHNASPRCARPFIKLNCAALGLKRTTLIYKMQRHGIFRPSLDSDAEMTASPSHAPPLSAMSIQGNAKTPTRSECFPGEG